MEWKCYIAILLMPIAYLVFWILLAPLMLGSMFIAMASEIVGKIKEIKRGY